MMRKYIATAAALASSSTLLVPTECFTLSPISTHHSTTHYLQPLKASTIDEDQSSSSPSSSPSPSSSSRSTLGGVSSFEKWFKSITSSNDNESMKLVRHNFFTNGRGLEFTGKKSDINNDDKAIISLPKDYVLQTTMIDRKDKDDIEDLSEEWDVSLSMQLLKECRLGEQSSLYGYCSLLTRGEDFDTAQPCPPSTAPDALRNWSDNEKEILASSKRGQRLINIEKKQSQEWNDKYASLSNTDREEYTYEQFKWAMEAVNSRAFKGDFSGQDPLKELSKALVPFAAGAFALNYMQSNPFGANDKVTLLLLIVSCAPVILNFLSENVVGSKMDAVMLPFIDSANHKESARSNIQFDPLKGAFTVTVEGGSSCIEKDGDKKQFYISYGEKRDTELLLNYGFLNSVQENYEDYDDRRGLLADIFNSRSLQ